MAHLFLIEQTYTASLAQVDTLVDSHMSWLDQGYANGTFIASGPQVPRKGVIMLGRAQSKAEMERILQSDPFVENEIADVSITEFIATKTNDALADLRSDK